MERRTSGRRKEVAEARVFFNNRKSGFNCTVRDFSPNGARISVSERDRVPDEFELYVPNKQKAFPARVRWRQKDEVGVAFAPFENEDADATAGAIKHLNKRIEKLETELVSLTQRLNELVASLR